MQDQINISDEEKEKFRQAVENRSFWFIKDIGIVSNIKPDYSIYEVHEVENTDNLTLIIRDEPDDFDIYKLGDNLFYTEKEAIEKAMEDLAKNIHDLKFKYFWHRKRHQEIAPEEWINDFQTKRD